MKVTTDRDIFQQNSNFKFFISKAPFVWKASALYVKRTWIFQTFHSRRDIVFCSSEWGEKLLFVLIASAFVCSGGMISRKNYEKTKISTKSYHDFPWLMTLNRSISLPLFVKETKNQPHSTQPPQSPPQKAVSFFVNKTISSVLKSSRKIIFRVCEVANVKKQFKMFQIYSHIQVFIRKSFEIAFLTLRSSIQRRAEEQKEPETTGHDRFYQERSRYGISEFYWEIESFSVFREVRRASIRIF